MPRSDWEWAKTVGCRGTTRTCICGFRDRRPAVRRPGNGGGLRSRPSATESPLALAPRPLASRVNPPRMVRLLGIAPRSADYRSAALLLSYGRIRNGGERRSCAPIGLADPSVFETASAPRRIHSPLVPAAGFAPALFRLEGGGLSCSATRRNWTSRRDSHPQCRVRSAG